MFETLKRLFSAGKIGMAELDNAVTKGWLTEEQKAMIAEAQNDD